MSQTAAFGTLMLAAAGLLWFNAAAHSAGAASPGTGARPGVTTTQGTTPAVPVVVSSSTPRILLVGSEPSAARGAPGPGTSPPPTASSPGPSPSPTRTRRPSPSPTPSGQPSPGAVSVRVAVVLAPSPLVGASVGLAAEALHVARVQLGLALGRR